jgi:chaperone modulatory protein CbpM
MEEKIIFEINEIVEIYELNEFFICSCIENEWIKPCDAGRDLLDNEDIARMLLIRDLKEDFDVNDESVPIILHLIDQIHWLQSQLTHYIKTTGRK